MPTMPQDDIDRIMAVMTCAFDPAYGEAWTRAQVENALLLGNCHKWLITPEGMRAEDGEAAAGFALARSVLDEAELLLFAVSPEWRGRGIGARLLSYVQDDLKKSGVYTLMLEMRRGNPAESLYTRHGFTPIGMRPKYYRTIHGDRIDAITFSSTLANTGN
jgi:ribosomal-protein-alanine N-acetyltransferase